MTAEVLHWWAEYGAAVANVATTLGLIAAGASAVVAAVTFQRMKRLQVERNTFDFMQSFQRDERFLSGQRLLDEFRRARRWPRYYDLAPDQRLPITALMNAYQMASDFSDRGFIDGEMFVAGYGWYLQTHWLWTERYVREIRERSVGGTDSFAGFEQLKDRAAELLPELAARLTPE